MPRKKIRRHKPGAIDDVLRRSLGEVESVNQLAEKANVSGCHLRRFIRKENTLTVETADKLLRALYGEGCYLIVRVSALDHAMLAARSGSAL